MPALITNNNIMNGYRSAIFLLLINLAYDNSVNCFADDDPCMKRLMKYRIDRVWQYGVGDECKIRNGNDFEKWTIRVEGIKDVVIKLNEEIQSTGVAFQSSEAVFDVWTVKYSSRMGDDCESVRKFLIDSTLSIGSQFNSSASLKCQRVAVSHSVKRRIAEQIDYAVQDRYCDFKFNYLIFRSLGNKERVGHLQRIYLRPAEFRLHTRPEASVYNSSTPVYISCHEECDDGGGRVTYSRRLVLCPDVGGNCSRVAASPSLMISSVEAGDTGEYTCRLRLNKTVIVQSKTVIVMAAPKRKQLRIFKDACRLEDTKRLGRFSLLTGPAYPTPWHSCSLTGLAVESNISEQLTVYRLSTQLGANGSLTTVWTAGEALDGVYGAYTIICRVFGRLDNSILPEIGQNFSYSDIVNSSIRCDPKVKAVLITERSNWIPFAILAPFIIGVPAAAIYVAITHHPIWKAKA